MKLGFQQNARMKMTLDLPDELVRRVKMRAVQSDRKLKDTVAELLETGLRAASGTPSPAAPPVPVKLRGRGPFTAADIERSIAQGRD
jgi:plasmid stability protein